MPEKRNVIDEIALAQWRDAVTRKELDTRAADFGTITQGNTMDSYPVLQQVYEGALEMLGVAPSKRVMQRIDQAQSPVLRPQTPFGWADWGAGLAADTAQTGLAAADLAGVVGAASPFARQMMASQRGAIDLPTGPGVKSGAKTGGENMARFKMLSDDDIEKIYQPGFDADKNERLSYLRKELGQTSRTTTAPSSFSKEPTLADRRWKLDIENADTVKEYNEAVAELSVLEKEKKISDDSFQAVVRKRWEDAESENKIVFLRFGKPPKGGKSFNHAHGFQEEGVSVYKAIDHGNNRFEIDPVSSFVFTGPMASLVRPLYVVKGKNLGMFGSDGEPLVKALSSKKIANAKMYHPVTGWIEKGAIRESGKGEDLQQLVKDEIDKMK